MAVLSSLLYHHIGCNMSADSAHYEKIPPENYQTPKIKKHDVEDNWWRVNRGWDMKCNGSGG